MSIPKFRIWNPGGNRMLYDVDNVYECLKQQHVHDKTQETRGFTVGYNHTADGMVWLQCLDITDSFGHELYVGDVVEYDYEYDADYDGDIPIVKRSVGRAAIKHINDTYFVNLPKREGGTVKLIGNFYQSPELAKN